MIDGDRIEEIGAVESFKDLETRLPEGSVYETEVGEFFQVRKEDAKRYLEAQLNSFRIAREEGVKIAMGIDASESCVMERMLPNLR